MANPSEPGEEAREVLLVTSRPDATPDPVAAAYRLRALDFRWLSVLLSAAGAVLLGMAFFAPLVCGAPCRYDWPEVFDSPSLYSGLGLLSVAGPCRLHAQRLAEKGGRTDVRATA